MNDLVNAGELITELGLSFNTQADFVEFYRLQNVFFRNKGRGQTALLTKEQAEYVRERVIRTRRHEETAAAKAAKKAKREAVVITQVLPEPVVLIREQAPLAFAPSATEIKLLEDVAYLREAVVALQRQLAAANAGLGLILKSFELEVAA